jgi:hypothetical protein
VSSQQIDIDDTYPISIEERTMKRVSLNTGLTRKNDFNKKDNNYYKFNDDSLSKFFMPMIVG